MQIDGKGMSVYMYTVRYQSRTTLHMATSPIADLGELVRNLETVVVMWGASCTYTFTRSREARLRCKTDRFAEVRHDVGPMWIMS